VTPEFASANADAIAEMREKSARINSPAALVHAIDACISFNVKDRMSQISHPTLIISGREDELSPIHLAEKIHRSIKGSEWKIMEEVGHTSLFLKSWPKIMGINFSRLKALREKADYSPRIEATGEDAEWSLQAAEVFLKETMLRLR